jgi:hypothetical protein
MVTRITREWLEEHDACYLAHDATAEQRALVDALPDEGVSVLDVLQSSIPAEDRIWVLTRPGAVPDATIRRWLGRVVRRALGRVASPDERSLAVLAYLDRGEAVPEDVRREAWGAAAAARYYAYAAADAAASAAADADAAASAAADAAADAADAAASADAAAAELDQQVADAIAVMGESS